METTYPIEDQNDNIEDFMEFYPILFQPQNKMGSGEYSMSKMR